MTNITKWENMGYSGRLRWSEEEMLKIKVKNHGVWI